MTTTANAVLTHLVEGGAQQATAANDAFNLIDALLQGRVINSNPSTTPPGGPSEGDIYIVPASATGDWSGQDDDVAIYLSGWVFRTPKEGWFFWDQTNDKFVRFDGTNWVDFQAADVGALTDSTTGSATSTIGDVGASFSQGNINDNFASVTAQINAIRTALRDADLMA